MASENGNDWYANMISFYHDIEQDFDSHSDVDKCLNAVSEMLKIEKRNGISSTYNIVGKLYIDQPDLIDKILLYGQEVSFHSSTHPVDWNPNIYSTQVRESRSLSDVPLGYRSPKSQWNNDTLKELWERSFIWNAENDYRDEPYFIYKGLVRLPIANDDWRLFKDGLSIRKWIDGFVENMERRRFFAFGSHDYITSYNPEERLGAWEKILEISNDRGSLSVNCSEAALLFIHSAYKRPDLYPFLQNEADPGPKHMIQISKENEITRYNGRSVEEIKKITPSKFKFHHMGFFQKHIKPNFLRCGRYLPKNIRDLIPSNVKY